MKKTLYALPFLRHIYNRFLSDRKTRVATAVARMQKRIAVGDTSGALRIQKKLELKFGVTISHQAKIGQNVQFKHPIGVVVGRGAVIGDNVAIFQNVTIGGKQGKFPSIGKNTTIYANSSICGPISIGSDVIIGIGSVVVKDIPNGVIAAGNPCRIIRTK